MRKKFLIKTDNDGTIEVWEAKEVKRIKANKQKEEVNSEELALED